jgi:hypothetical protein
MNLPPADTRPLAARPQGDHFDAEVINRFRLLVTAHRDGTLHESGFVCMMLQLEADLARPNGFIITASNTQDGWTAVELRMRGRSNPCAAFEFLPSSAQSRQPAWLSRDEAVLES